MEDREKSIKLHCGTIFWGLLIGSWVGGIPGALIGAIIGAVIDSPKMMVKGGARQSFDKRQAVADVITDLMLEIARADGEISSREISHIITFFSQLNFTGPEIERIRSRIMNFKPDEHPLPDLCRRANAVFNYQEKLIIIESLFRIALSDGIISDPEVKRIRQIGNLMSISRIDFMSIQSNYVGAAGNDNVYQRRSSLDPYEILNVSPDATMDEIKKAYRKLAMQYHPDKVQHLGEEFKKIAEEKMKRINEAYTVLGGRDN